VGSGFYVVGLSKREVEKEGITTICGLGIKD